MIINNDNNNDNNNNNNENDNNGLCLITIFIVVEDDCIRLKIGPGIFKPVDNFIKGYRIPLRELSKI